MISTEDSVTLKQFNRNLIDNLWLKIEMNSHYKKLS
jgi:hypothetical protein